MKKPFPFNPFEKAGLIELSRKSRSQSTHLKSRSHSIQLKNRSHSTHMKKPFSFYSIEKSRPH
jgi:hypothetical protein